VTPCVFVLYFYGRSKNRKDTMNGKRECPYCKEEIKKDAIKCKHCHSMVALAHPEHNGTCPFCKENVKPDAIKCRHCGSQITGGINDEKRSCDCCQPPSIIASALRDNQGSTGYSGNDCYYDCRDHMEGRGESPAGAKYVCESICQISMPFASQLARFRR
jgi:hypothetical protein